MKIGLTTSSFRVDQGAERFVVNLAKGLLQADHEVHVVGRLEHKPTLERFCDQLTGNQLERFHFHRIRTVKAYRYTNLVTFARGVHRVLNTLDADVVQGFGKSLGIDVFRQPQASFKSMLQITGGKVRSRLASQLELDIERRIFYEDGKAVVVNSNYAKGTLLDAYPDIEIPIHVIYNMVDVASLTLDRPDEARRALREKIDIPDDAIVFLHVSTNFKLKGAPDALEGFRYLREHYKDKRLDNVYLLLVGEEGYPVPADLQDRAMVFPRTADIRPYYAAADVQLHPTHYDPFANVVLEAIASGIPAITSKNTGAAEIIEADVNGSVLDDLSPECIGNTLWRYLTELDLDRMKTNTRITAQKFTPESITANYLNLYESVLRMKKTRHYPLKLKALEALFRSSQ